MVQWVKEKWSDAQGKYVRVDNPQPDAPKAKPRKRKYVSTVDTTPQPYPVKERERESVKERDGIKVGHVYLTRIGPVQVKTIFRRAGFDWQARVIAADYHQEVMDLAELVESVRGKKRYVYGCYTVGKGRVRRRKVNPRSVILYAQRPGGRLLKYLGHAKFGFRGKPLRFRTQAHANLAAWLLKDTFPDVLRPYRLFAQ